MNTAGEAGQLPTADQSGAFAAVDSEEASPDPTDTQQSEAEVASADSVEDPRVASAVERAGDAADQPVGERVEVFRDVLGRLNSALADEDGS